MIDGANRDSKTRGGCTPRPTRPPIEADLLTVQQVAVGIQASTKKINELIKRGALASVRIGSARRVLRSSYDKLIAEGAPGPANKGGRDRGTHRAA